MLGKLLKYDLRSVFKGWCVAMLTMIFSALGASIAYRVYREILFSDSKQDLAIVELVSIVAFIIGVVVVGICFVSVLIMVYVRFFKHLFTDEGYLTFTLPVSRKQIFFSKMTNAFVWTTLSCSVLFICLLFFVLISTPTSEKELFAIDTFKTYYQMLERDFESRGDWMILEALLAILIILANIVLSNAVVYFCITLGSTVVKKGKVLVSVAVFYLLNMAYSTLVQIVSGISIVSFFVGYLNILARLEFNVIDPAATLMLAVTFAIISTLAAFFYCLTLNILERKLNLA